MKRRHLLGTLAALPLAHALAAPPRAIAQRPLARVIVDNDFAGDPDGLVALAHQLLAPTTRTVLVTTSALDAKLAGLAGLDPTSTATAGARLAREMLRRFFPSARPPVVAGDGMDGAAARAIVAEALRDDPLPLVLACGGPLANVAAALRLRPDIAGRMSLVWIGGLADGGAEYNLSTDIAAARTVFEDSRLPVLQIPAEEYRRFQVAVAELETTFRTISPLAAWLVDRYRRLPPFVRLAGTLTFGDSPLVTATAFDPAATPFAVRPVRRILDDGSHGDVIPGRDVRVAHGLDPRLNLADFAALLRRNAPA
ncbi:Inosine-uridine nucleoside N-ribohydrolase [Massilia sp. PDC64]|nr:nucleoside hydrolase [Massilia sp. PDC64]SDE76368.1 Inosine-uridine nucleoside N-ribohydrolase [Massilia sp. PDC64]